MSPTLNNTTSCHIENIQAQIQQLQRINSLLLLRISQLEDIIHNLTDNLHDYGILDHNTFIDTPPYYNNTTFDWTFHTNFVII
jgi:hypothetical protein